MRACIRYIRDGREPAKVMLKSNHGLGFLHMRTVEKLFAPARLLALVALLVALETRGAERPPVTAPPESFFQIVSERDRDAARKFYGKYIDVNGMPVVAHGDVADLALQRTHEIVTHMLVGRPDVLAAMVSNGMYLIIIGKDQVYTDMPEYRRHPNPAYQNERVRGTGGKPTSFGEENLLNLLLDRYDDESIGVHEFCHTIDGALRSIDPTWSKRKNETFQNAKSKGLWKNVYAGGNAGEYWAEIAQSYFDCNRVNNWNHAHVGTREQLKEYDPEGYALVHSVFNLTPANDWRYRPLQKQPSVIAPPAKFKIDPWYTKFTWAREFVVVGRGASDDAMLQANDTIRKMFAYRHDILKALIADGMKLVVLEKNELLTDLPECKAAADKLKIDPRARRFSYHPECKLVVIGEEEIVSGTNASKPATSPVIGEFARALYHVTGTRPVDPNWENRGRDVQQYELRVKRLDIQFDNRLKEIHEAAAGKGLWKGTLAAKERVEYWAVGVQAYFDAGGDSKVATRDRLKEHDPELYALVHETMAYQDRQDWRFLMQTGAQTITSP